MAPPGEKVSHMGFDFDDDCGNFSGDGVKTFFPKQRHLTWHRCRDRKRAKTLRIRSRQHCDAIKVFDTETLSMYS